MAGGCDQWRAALTFNGSHVILGRSPFAQKTGPVNPTAETIGTGEVNMNVPDIERLRRELAEYVEVAEENPEDLHAEALRGKRTLQELMNEVIRITSTQKSPEICDPETTSAYNAEERELHSVERAVFNIQEEGHVQPVAVHSTPQGSTEGSLAEEPDHRSDARAALFSPVRWVFLCAFLMALLGAVAGALFLLPHGATDRTEPVAVATTVEHPVPATPMVDAAKSDLAPERTATSTSASVEPPQEVETPSALIPPHSTGALQANNSRPEIAAAASASLATAATSRHQPTKQAKRKRGSVPARKAPVHP
jgi:hypothetical protein